MTKEIPAPDSGEPEQAQNDEHPLLLGVKVGSLYAPAPDPGETAGTFGEPGPALSRSSAFYRGLWATVGALAAAGAAVALVQVADVLILVVIAAFLAIGLNPIVEMLIARLGFSRGWSVLAVTVLGIAIVSVVVFFVVNELQSQVTGLIDDAPQLLRNLQNHESFRRLDDQYNIVRNIDARLNDPDLGPKILSRIFSTGLGAVQAIVSTIVVFVLTIYFLAGLPAIKRAMYSLAPASRRERVGTLGDEILRRTGRYVVGAALVALLAGTVTFTFTFAVGLGQYAVALALLVALLDLVPLVGSATGAAAVVLLCFVDSFHTGLIAAVFYLIYEGLEGYVVYPRVMRSSVDVPEYVTVIAVLAGGTLGGIAGALLALPIAAAGLLLIREVWVRRQELS